MLRLGLLSPLALVRPTGCSLFITVFATTLKMKTFTLQSNVSLEASYKEQEV